MKSNCMYEDIPPQTKIFNTVILILMYVLAFTHRRYSILHQPLASSLTLNSNVDQSQATLLMTSGF